MGAADLLAAATVDRTTDYAMRVVGGDEVVGPWVRLAAQRHLEDLERGAERGLAWHPDRAQHAIEFIECLRHYQGKHAGRRFILSAHQAFIVGSCFGWYVGELRNEAGELLDPGQRRFRVAYVEEGKGNGKTPLAAAVGLYGLVADGEAGAEIYSAATGRDQAAIAFNDARQFVQACPPLLNRLEVGTANLAYLATSSFFRTVSAEGRGLDGKRPHIVLVDELHEHPTATVVEKMRAGTKGRTRALILEITNSGYDQESVCYEHHDYSIKVLQGVIENDTWFAFVCSLDKRDDPFADESCWPKANPNLGVSVTHEYLREQVREARDLPSKRSLVLRLNFCRWTEASENWVDLDHWDACATPVDEAALRGRRCFGGLDLASVSDFTSCVYVFPPAADASGVVPDAALWEVVVRLWLPEAAVAKLKARANLVNLDSWIEAGLIAVTPGNVCDYDHVRRQINADRAAFDLGELGADRWNSTQLVSNLLDDGVPVVQFGQGFASMSGPCKELERLYMSHRLAHGGHKVLRWMASNVVATKDAADNIKFDRAKVKNKIDAMVALAMALGRAIAPREEEPEPGVITDLLEPRVTA